MKNAVVKNHLIWLWAKNKERYGIKIHEFIVMDNHAHLLIYVQDVENLGHFMRTVNSQLARFINKLEGRDSQAIRERYKSPLITNENYLRKTMQYIWLNRFHVDKRNPSEDPYCSASWRLDPAFISYISQNDGKQAIIQKLLDPYPEFESLSLSKFRRFVRDLLNAALSMATQLCKKFFESAYTIGDKLDIKIRDRILGSHHRVYAPIPMFP